MAYEKFDLAALAELDGGRIRETFAQLLARCEQDLKDRPGVKGARKIIVEVALNPVPDESGDLEMCDVTVELKDSIPKRSSRSYAMRPDRKGGLYFNEHAPENPSQRTIDETGIDPRKDVTDVG